MKYAVSEDTIIEKIPLDVNEIHLIRPIELKKIDYLLNNRAIKEITLAKSCFDRLPKKSKDFIKSKNVNLTLEKRRGRALVVSMDKMLEIVELRKDHQSIREIERVTGIAKSTIHYLLKYADRGKIKKGSNIIYLR
ncbi:MAG: hypothetical protein PHQ98_04315 [Candidatus ainarchaeum sp.]|nr:hypothetical protein [Candidatus ainarchaeum sp.]